MKANELKVLAIKSLEDVKGQNIVCLDVKEMTSVCDYMIVVTGTSNRHLKSLTDELGKTVKQAGAKVNGMEGQNQTEWILVDLGDVIVHAMLSATRELYDLEALWSITAERAENEIL
ncbi:MAG: ribosome silencing factor [Gammaproteobacteria bacterium]|nr:ribosome silencing factor [Gammaproteobacteria bacterium]